MPQYKTHNILNIFLGLPVCAAAIYLYYHPQKELLLTFSSVFIYSTLFMNPDLDLAYQVKPFSLRGILSLPFRLYAQLVRHRGISHSIFFGSLTRIVWLAAFFSCIFLMVYFIVPSKYFHYLPNENTFITFLKKYKSYILYAIAGVCCADWCHLVADHERSAL